MLGPGACHEREQPEDGDPMVGALTGTSLTTVGIATV